MARIVSGCFRIQVEFAIATEHGSSVGVFFDVIHELPEIDVPGLDVIALQIDASLNEHTAANLTADIALQNDVALKICLRMQHTAFIQTSGVSLPPNLKMPAIIILFN